MKNWNGTKCGVFGLQYASFILLQEGDFYESNNILDIEQVGENVVKENVILIKDAFNTIQKCGLLPSELLEKHDLLLDVAETQKAQLSTLLEQRDEALEMLKYLLRSNVIDAYKRMKANELINKITNK